MLLTQLTSRFEAIHERCRRWVDGAESRLGVSLGWMPTLVPTAVAAVQIGLVLVWRAAHPVFDAPLTRDSALYLYGGWLWQQGYVPYRYLWDIKPPAVFEVVALAATLAGGSLDTTETIATVTAGLSAVLAIGVLTAVVHRLTDDWVAAIGAGLFPLAYLPYSWFLSGGPRAKYYALLPAMLAVYWYIDDRPVASGFAAALATAFWQPLLVFPVGVVVGFYRTRDRQSTLRSVAGVGGATVLVLGPVVLSGGGTAMVFQTIVAPLITGYTSSSPLGSLAALQRWFGPTLFVPLYGLAGMLVALDPTAPEQPRGTYWTLAVLWFLVAALFLAQLNADDLFYLTVMAALATGILLHRIRMIAYDPVRDSRVLQVGAWAVIALFLLTVSVRIGIVADTTWGRIPLHGDEMVPIYWRGGVVSDCHLYMTSIERAWIDRFGLDPNAPVCMGSESIGRVVRAVFGSG